MQSAPEVALALLTGAAEECEALGPKKRREALASLQAVATQVLDTLGATLNTMLGHPGMPPLYKVKAGVP